MKTKHMHIPHKSTCANHKRVKTASLATRTPGPRHSTLALKDVKHFRFALHHRASMTWRSHKEQTPECLHGAATNSIARGGSQPIKKREKRERETTSATDQKHSNHGRHDSRPTAHTHPRAAAIIPRCNNLMHFITLVITLYIPRVASESPDPAVKSTS